MKTTKIITLLIVTTIYISCVPIASLEDGRSLGKGWNEISCVVNTVSISRDSINLPGSFPIVEIKFNRGVTNRLDLGFSLNSSLIPSLKTKFQVIGNKSSFFASSVGVSIGMTLSMSETNIIENYNCQFTSFNSIHVKNLSSFMNPKYIYLNSPVDEYYDLEQSIFKFNSLNYGFIFNNGSSRWGTEMTYSKVEEQIISSYAISYTYRFYEK